MTCNSKQHLFWSAFCFRHNNLRQIYGLFVLVNVNALYHLKSCLDLFYVKQAWNTQQANKTCAGGRL